MEPIEVNAGHFYCRPLRHDSHVDDAPVTTQLLVELVPDSVVEFFQNSTAGWGNDTAYHFAVAEQTNVEMLALATVEVIDAGHVSITVHPAGNPARVLPDDDQVLVKVIIADDVEAAEKTLHRQAEDFLGRKISQPS